MAYKLTTEQKKEVRRLTQRANRRIEQAFKVYEGEGKRVVPYAVTGGIQVRQDWETEKYALSRSTNFASKKEYENRMRLLRDFQPGRATSIPTMTEFTEIQRFKALKAVETSVGGFTSKNVPSYFAQDVWDKLEGMTAPQIASFWKTYSSKAGKLALNYSSGDSMISTLNEFFDEDIFELIS